ncbi:MAG TPA: hypothetical protein VF266_10655 [Thermoanaerobaculia bacterium]
MHRILLLDSEQPQRAQLAEAIARVANAEVVLAADEEELLSQVTGGAWAAVFADEELLPNGVGRLVGALRRTIARPMLIIASNGKSADLDPDMVTLVVRRPYDVPTLTGILLAAIPRADAGSLPHEDGSVFFRV